MRLHTTNVTMTPKKRPRESTASKDRSEGRTAASCGVSHRKCLVPTLPCAVDSAPAVPAHFFRCYSDFSPKIHSYGMIS